MPKLSEKMTNPDESGQIRSTSLEESLVRLERLTKNLQVFGLLIFLLTLLNWFYLFTILFVSFFARRYSPTIIFFVPLALYTITLMSIFRYETSRKWGYTLFEEISDELEWYIQPETSKPLPSHPIERPALRARIVLRSFARNTDLPLVPGKYGPAFYTIFNIFPILFSFLSYRF